MMWSDKLIDCVDKTGYAWAGARRVINNPYTGELAQIIEPTYEAIDLIPNDIEILHWYWSVYEEYDEYFKERGFQTVFANFEPLRVKNILNRLKKGIDGIGISNWSMVDDIHIHRNGIYFDMAMSSMIVWSNDYCEEKVDYNLKKTADDLYNRRIGKSKYKAEIVHTFTKDIPFVLYLDGLSVDENESIIGEYEVEFSDGSIKSYAMEYGRTVGFDKVNRKYEISNWCSSYETDKRIIEPAYSCTLEFYEDRTFYRYGITSDKEIRDVKIKLKDEYSNYIEIKDVIIS